MAKNTGSKWLAPADAVALVKSGMTVGLGHVGVEPISLTAALWQRAEALRDVTLLSGMMLTGYPFLKPQFRESFTLKTWFMPGTLMSGVARDVEAHYLPLDWTQTARLLRSGIVDIALVQVGEADRDGYHSLGISTGQHRPLIDGAKFVIAEVNPAMPRTRGQSLVHESELDVLVKADHPLIPFPNRPGDAVDEAIGRRAAELVPDGATVQFGIGSIPSAMLKGLVELERKDLRILSQVTDPARELIESNVVVKDGPKALIGEVLGSTGLYDWAHENDDLYMVDAFESHTLESFVSRGKFVSVNSALEIDLYGQVNSEVLDGRQVGAIGGSLDFAMGAQFDGNRSVIALRSATKKGAPRVVPCLKPGPVTTPRSLVQMVVTEHGTVDLRGKTARERATLLAGIAHPDHREALLRAAAEIR